MNRHCLRNDKERWSANKNSTRFCLDLSLIMTRASRITSRLRHEIVSFRRERHVLGDGGRAMGIEGQVSERFLRGAMTPPDAALRRVLIQIAPPIFASPARPLAYFHVRSWLWIFAGRGRRRIPVTVCRQRSCV